MSDGKGEGTALGRGARWGVMALLFLGAHQGWFALAGAGRPPRVKVKAVPEVPPSESGETPASQVELVKPAQKPAPEIEDQYKSFTGNRAPPGGAVELSVERTEDGQYRVNEVDPKGPFAGRYLPGEKVEEMPSPSEATDDASAEHVSGSQPKSSEGAAR